MRAQGVTNEKEIERRLATGEYEMQKAAEKKKRARYQLADPAKMSCNTSQLKLDESEPEEMGDIHKLKQDLYGVETDFKYDFRFDKPIEPLKIEERNMRVAKARLRLRQRKVFAEDTLGAPQQKMITHNDEIPPSTDRDNHSVKKVRLNISAAGDEPS